MHLIYLLYLVECFKYAFNILTVSDGMCSINLGGLQADIKGGLGGGGSPPRKYGLISLLPVPGQYSSYVLQSLSVCMGVLWDQGS